MSKEILIAALFIAMFATISHAHNFTWSATNITNETNLSFSINVVNHSELNDSLTPVITNLTTILQRLDNLTQNVSTMQTNISELKTTISNIQHYLEVINATISVVTYQEFNRISEEKFNDFENEMNERIKTAIFQTEGFINMTSSLNNTIKNYTATIYNDLNSGLSQAYEKSSADSTNAIIISITFATIVSAIIFFINRRMKIPTISNIKEPEIRRLHIYEEEIEKKNAIKKLQSIVLSKKLHPHIKAKLLSMINLGEITNEEDIRHQTEVLKTLKDGGEKIERKP